MAGIDFKISEFLLLPPQAPLYAILRCSYEMTLVFRSELKPFPIGIFVFLPNDTRECDTREWERIPNDTREFPPFPGIIPGKKKL